MIQRNGALNSYYLTQLVLEALRTALFHLRLTESQLVLLTLHVMIIEIVPNRMCETMLQALLPEVFRHFIQITLTAPIRLARLHVAITDEKMHMNMVGVGMHREQHLEALAVYEMLREILRDLESCLVIDVIQRVKRDRHFMRKDRVLLVLRVAFPVQLAGDENIVRKVLTVAAERGVKLSIGFLHTAFALLLLPTEDIVSRSFQRPDRLAGRVIHIDVPERH